MYFNTIIDNFNKLPLEERPKKAIYKYLFGVFSVQVGNGELSKDHIEEAFELDANLKSSYPEYFSK